MRMTRYIEEIQRRFVTEYHFSDLAAVPDGEYPMLIDGKLDRVRIEGGKIHCCNYAD
jgi:hypothetical protein